VRLWATSDGAPAGEWIRGQPGWFLTDMDLAPDGALVATAGTQGCFCALLWNTATGKPVGNPLRHRNAVPTARFNATGTRLVTAGYDRIVQVWNVATTEPAAPPWTISGWPESVRFSPDGQLLASTVNGAAEVIAPGSNAERENSRLFPTFMHAGPVTSSTFDGSGRFLVTASGDGAVRVWDLSNALIAEAPFAWYASHWTTHVIFSGDGRYLASEARIFDTSSGLPAVPPLRVEARDYDFHLTLSPDGRRIATAGPRLARVWDTATGEPVSPVLAHQGDLAVEGPLVFSPDGRRLLTLSNPDGRGEATIWDIATGARVIALKHGGRVTAGGFSTDGARLITASAERDINLRVWNIDRGTVAFSGRHPEGIHLAILDRSDDRILTVGYDQRVLEWQIGSTLASKEALQLHSEPASLAIGARGTLVAGGRGGDVRVRTLGSGAESSTNMYQPGAVLSADISPDGEWLVTSGDDGRANLWNLRSGERLSPAYRIGGPIESVRFSPDGSWFGMSGPGVYLQALVPDNRPTALLTDVAELVSARRLVNASDSPLRLDDLVQRWSRLSSADTPDVVKAAPSWYRRQASLALFRANPALALDHLASLRALGRFSWTDTMIALAALAKAGRWDEAVQEIQRLAAAREAAPEMRFVEVVAKRRAGDLQASRAACSELLARHGATKNPDRALWILRTCLLDPDAASEAARQTTATLLGQLIDLPGYGTRDSFAGAFAVRSGRFPEAIELLTRAAAAEEKTPHTTLFLAMAYARMHRTGEATKWLRESETFTWPVTITFSQKAFRDAWFDAEAVVLRDEVRQILAGAARPASPAR
jgi:WD40 repeat protein/tetratricopeptide (TPR) repeat protein